MNSDVARKIADKVRDYQAWSTGQQFERCRSVHYCGPDMVGAVDIPTSEIETRIDSLLAEGFYVDWHCQASTLYLRVWEFGGDEPSWECVYAESNLPSA
jgi:hypothetical protein